MENIVGVLIPRDVFDKKGININKDAVYMPITIYGKPIGFISGVTDKAITACLWTKDWSVIQDENENLLGVELMESKQKDWALDLGDI